MEILKEFKKKMEKFEKGQKLSKKSFKFKS